MTSYALEADNLVKRYGPRLAVNQISFKIPQGAIYGVLGPNGAGKSSTLRMLVGVLRPTAGNITLLGGPITRKTLRRIGYLPEERGLYRNMSARAAIAYLARLKGMGAGKAFKRADQLLERHGLGAVRRKKLKTLSKGMAQKVQVLAAIAHEPELIVFDEPFSGLDPVNQQVLEETIRAEAAAGRTILFSTHVMEHAERLCDSIMLIAEGRKAFEGATAQALALVPASAMLETEGAFDLAAALGQRGLSVERLDDVDGRGRWRAPLSGPQAARRLLAACVEAQAPLSLFEPGKATLHDAFVQLVGAEAALRAQAQ
jgi:ABC-2 type transport system ATP-binding protein